MNIQLITGSLSDTACDVLAVGIFEGGEASFSAAQAISETLRGQIIDILNNQPDSTKFGTTSILHVSYGKDTRKVVLLGLGKPQDFSLERVRGVAGEAVRAARKFSAKSLGLVVPGLGDQAGVDPLKVGQAIAEGAVLGSYQFLHYKTDKPSLNGSELDFLFVSVGSKYLEPIKDGIGIGQVIARGVNLTRDLVNHPANVMTPGKMAWHATQIAEKSDLEVTVLEKADIEKLQMNTFLAVAQGSDEPPKLIILKHMGNPSDSKLVALIGKGITFDSGGISLKPSEGMQDMRDDMGGAATVLGAMQAISELQLPVNVLAVVPCTENMPSGHASRPGDVITSMSGKTIEIISTDAEGRLILADAITYARQLGATHMVDLATLTGAIVVALGRITSGVMTNNPEWCQQVLDAAQATGEKMWQMPIFEEYKEQIKSDIADMKNSGGRPGGALTAALFLANFAETTPWVHIDIAGTVTTEKEKGYQVKGATGVGVRTLVELISTLK